MLERDLTLDQIIAARPGRITSAEQIDRIAAAHYLSNTRGLSRPVAIAIACGALTTTESTRDLARAIRLLQPETC